MDNRKKSKSKSKSKASKSRDNNNPNDSKLTVDTTSNQNSREIVPKPQSDRQFVDVSESTLDSNWAIVSYILYWLVFTLPYFQLIRCLFGYRPIYLNSFFNITHTNQIETCSFSCSSPRQCHPTSGTLTRRLSSRRASLKSKHLHSKKKTQIG